MKVYKTAESVSVGHPDSFMDFVGNSIMDAYLGQDPHARFALDGVCKNHDITLAGEITSTATVDIPSIVRKCVDYVGYNFIPNVTLHVYQQSPDIAQGTNDEVQGAGDQGTITGYADNTSKGMIPLEKYLADSLMYNLFTKYRGDDKIKPDMKSQVTITYDSEEEFRNGNYEIDTIVLAVQHAESVDTNELKEQLIRDVKDVLSLEGIDESKYEHTSFIINGTGKFVIGGPEADSGEIGRKIVVDSYGVSVPVGGGNQNAKDSTKVDVSAALYARYVAKNLVAAEFADKCLITVSYCIGMAQPISVDIECYGTNKYPMDAINDVVRATFDFTPLGMTKELQLRAPHYASAFMMGHFGREVKDEFGSLIALPWERIDLAEQLKESMENYLDFIDNKEEEK